MINIYVWVILLTVFAVTFLPDIFHKMNPTF